MPILLDDINIAAASAAGKALTPKFFSSALTGQGKKGGRLNENLRPGRYPSGHDANTVSIESLDRKSKSSGSGVVTQHIPVGVLTRYSVHHNIGRGLTLPFEQDPERRFHINEGRSNNLVDAYLTMTPQGISVIEDDSGDKKVTTVRVLYRMEVTLVAEGDSPERVKVVADALRNYGGNKMVTGNEFTLVDFSYAPLDDAPALIQKATDGYSAAGNSIFVDHDALAEWMAEYDVYTHVCELAEVWSSDEISGVIGLHIQEIFSNPLPTTAQLQSLVGQLRFLETYPVTLEAYRQIHQSIQTHAPAELALTMSKQNLNLLMNSTLEDLEQHKAQLSTPPLPVSSANPLPKYFSTQQRNAIATDEPLVLVQAGAGTGKSTVILARIDHLISRGVDPKDITVLSFTNAAADNIKEKNPDIGSMTIASMIHEIYHLNHPTHELSSIDTILNSLDIFYPDSEFARAFRKHLMDIDKNLAGATTRLNVFIEKYQAETIEVLNTLRQTCLELEIIIAYQQIDQMVEPASVQAKYLIVDEVQDNSIFEFIYTLRYVAKHEAAMFIVGDASQTLYEFRAANPRALNALEGSGVFATYQLTTNYRSNQEILDFANVHLADIKANETAGLRLQANSLEAPTECSFREKVKLHYELVQKQADFKENYSDLLKSSMMREYIDDKVAKGEQVAFLMFTRDMAKTTQETLENMYPGKSVASLVSDRTYGTTVFTMYIKKFWNDVLQVPDVQQASFVVSKGITDNLDALTNNADRAKNSVARLVSNWWITNANDISGWVALVHSGSMSRDDFFDRLRTNLLDFEIAENRKKFTLTNERNRAKKEANSASDAAFVVSTIHGAKGLEFPHVVVVHKYESDMPEDAKRLYYVAFTRAMQTEFVLSYGKVKNARVVSDYDLMIAALQKRDQMQALRDMGVNPDVASEDEVAAALAKLEQNSAVYVAPEEGAAVDQGVTVSEDTVSEDEPAQEPVGAAV